MKIQYFIVSLALTTICFFGSLTAQTERYTTESDVGLSISNIGVLGNAFKGSYQLNKAPSCKYPKNSSVEHLFEAGIWVGAIVRGSANVSTTAYDNSKGYSEGTGGYEFTAEKNAAIKERSTLFNNRQFSKDAVSHQDFVMDYTEKHVIVPGTEKPVIDHDQPLGLDVHLETYNWNYAFSNFFIILNYTFTNNGDNTLDSLFIGMFANAVVRNVNISPAGSGGTSFYNQGGNGYNDSLHLGYCYDAGGDLGFTESYFAHKFLGAESNGKYYHPSNDKNFKVHYNAWTWSNSSNPILFSPSDDAQKYRKMSSGLNYRPDWTAAYDSTNQGSEPYLSDQIKTAGNRSDLVSVGPFASLKPGESVQIAFAVICAKKNEDGNPNIDNNAVQQRNLINNAGWAQTAYQGEDTDGDGVLDPGEDRNNNAILDRFILPSPPNAPITRFEAKDNSLTIYWSNNSESSVDPISLKKDFAGYRLYLSKLGFDVQQKVDPTAALTEIGMFDKKGDSLFFETGLLPVRLAEPITFENDTNLYHYSYTIDNLKNGWQYIAALTAFDTGDKTNKLESLESSPLSNSKRVFVGTPPNENLKENGPFAYPNPYYLEAAWEGFSTRQTTKKLIFANLPQHCMVTIFNMAGDLVDQFEHDQTYTGDDIDWFTEFSDENATQFSGGEHAWNLISSEGQAVSRGLYLFTVKDLSDNKIYKGKFTLIK